MSDVIKRLNRAAGMLGELTPILLARVGAYTVVGLITCVYWLVVAGLCLVLGKFVPAIGWIVFVIALAGNYGLLRLGRDYLLYMVRAGFIAVLTEIIVRGRITGSENQLTFARDAVKTRFVETSALAGLDHLVHGVIQAYNATIEGIASWIPIPGLDKLVALINVVISHAASMVDEAILALSFARKDEDIWKVAQDGLILYAQNYQPILMISAACVLIDWTCMGLTFLMALVVIGIPMKVIAPASVTFLGLLFPVIITYVVRVGVVQPFLVTAVILTFLDCTKDSKIDEKTAPMLSQVSPAFKEIVSKIG